MIKELNILSKFSLMIVFVILGLPGPLSAQEVYVNTGSMKDIGSAKDSYSWSLEYLEGISEHVGLSFSWNRVVSTYNRDTDIFLLGLGYQF